MLASEYARPRAALKRRWGAEEFAMSELRQDCNFHREHTARYGGP